ncbi:ATP-sensitive inward rectifier potassium channel 11-like [Littorina saxatilis]|uniref:Uncharacterized protein n=1 Tax=Littorina saxatilis TaxID=31220 RepID=A0AAN9FX61_9CAEN
MASADKGYKVEELTPQTAWTPNTPRGAPRRTLLQKEGNSNVSYRGIERKPLKYLKDMYTTLVDMQWRWVMLVLFGAIFMCYLVFAVLYWLVCYMSGQFSHLNEPGFKPCIENLDTFSEAFLFSMETQSTIGFGALHPNAECPGVTPLVYFQITIGFMLETFVLGFLYVKIARPKHRRHTLVFSRNACLCLENGHLNFQIRVGDMRRTHLVDCTVHGVLVKRRVMAEKHVYPLFQHRINFEAHGMGNKVYLICPLVLSHRITPDSPLYNLSPKDVLKEKFDILIFLEGTIESTGELCQARTGYASRDIIWGHRFVRLEEYDEIHETWCCDFTRFNNVVPSMTPKVSARAYDEQQREEQERQLGDEESVGDPDRVYDNATGQESVGDLDGLYDNATGQASAE